MAPRGWSAIYMALLTELSRRPIPLKAANAPPAVRDLAFVHVARRPSVVELDVLEKIISGGQTGADRAALDFAIANGIAHGGWCPRGRLAEDGTIPDHYQLRETPGSDYAERTEWNVRDSAGTVIFSIAAALGGGSKLTAELAQHYRKPSLHLSRERDGKDAARKLFDFLARREVKTLNVAGPRESQEPAVGEFTRRTLEEWRANFGL